MPGLWEEAVNGPPVFVCGLCGTPNCPTHLRGLGLDEPWTEEDEAMVDFFKESGEAHQKAEAEKKRAQDAALKRYKERVERWRNGTKRS